MSQIIASSCADCFHPKENHYEKGVCTGDLTCRCDHYNAPYLYEFAHRVEQEKHARKSLFQRIKWLLEELPTIRNAGEKTFYKIYIEIWYGVKIRKNTGITLTKEVWDRIPNQDSVSRERRRVTDQDHFPQLGSYDKDVEWHKTAIYQALLEMSME